MYVLEYKIYNVKCLTGVTIMKDVELRKKNKVIQIKEVPTCNLFEKLIYK